MGPRPMTVKQQTLRLRVMLVGLGILFAGRGVGFLWSSSEGMDLRLRVGAALHNYQGCLCGDCAKAYRLGPDSNTYRSNAWIEPLGVGDPATVGTILAVYGGTLILAGVAGRRPIAALLGRLGPRPDRCRGCRYDLRGLPADAPCPECGKDRT